MLSLIEKWASGSGGEDENVNRLQTDGQTDGRTGNRQSEKLTWADRSGELVTRRVSEKQMLPIMANSKYGHDHNDNYFDSSCKKILSQKMKICN